MTGEDQDKTENDQSVTQTNADEIGLPQPIGSVQINPEIESADASKSGHSWTSRLILEFRHLSPLKQLKQLVPVIAVIGALLAAGNWLWPDPLQGVAPPNSQFITKAFGRDLDSQQIEQLLEALDSLRNPANKSETDAPTIQEALRQAEQGNTKLARGILEQIYEDREADRSAAREEQATAARHLASITFVDDKATALSLYRKATTLNPGDMLAWQGLGDAAMIAGTIAEVERAYRQYAELSTSRGDNWHEMAAYNRLGDALKRGGQLPGAEVAYNDALEIANIRLMANPDGFLEQRGLSVSHIKIGDVRVAEGNLPQALEAYRASLAIAEKLAAADPGNAGWQRDLLTSNVKLADTGDQPAKRLARALEIAQALRDTDRLNPADHWMIDELKKRIADQPDD